MGRFLALQWGIAVLMAAGFFFIFGKHSGITSALTSLSFLIPNTVFLLFYFSDFFKRQSRAMILFGFLELIKILLITVCAGLVLWLYKDLHWIAYLASFIVCLVSYIFLLSKLKG